MKLGEIAKNRAINDGTNCAVSVLLAASDFYNLGLTKEDAKLVVAYGGGVGCGNFCGALAGALAALGKILLPEGELTAPDFRDRCAGFLKKFEDEWGTVMCAPIKEKNSAHPLGCKLTMEITGNLLQEYLEEIKG